MVRMLIRRRPKPARPTQCIDRHCDNREIEIKDIGEGKIEVVCGKWTTSYTLKVGIDRFGRVYSIRKIDKQVMEEIQPIKTTGPDWKKLIGRLEKIICRGGRA